MLFGAYSAQFHYYYITILPSCEWSEHSHHNANISKQKEEGGYRVCYFIYRIILHYFLTFILSPTVVCFDCTNINSNLILLGELINRLKFSRQTSDLSIHTVLAQVVTIFDQWKNQTLCFGSLLSFSWVIFTIEKWLKQTHCVSYSTNIDTVLFHYLTSEKIRHYVLANLPC